MSSSLTTKLLRSSPPRYSSTPHQTHTQLISDPAPSTHYPLTIGTLRYVVDSFGTNMDLSTQCTQLVVAVPGLPRGALVEVAAVAAATGTSYSNDSDTAQCCLTENEAWCRAAGWAEDTIGEHYPNNMVQFIVACCFAEDTIEQTICYLESCTGWGRSTVATLRVYLGPNISVVPPAAAGMYTLE